MKKILFLFVSAMLFIACDNDLVDTNANEGEALCYLGYSPKGTPEEVHLSNGLTIYMDVDSTYFLGDLIFSKEQVEQLNSRKARSAAVKARVRYWPNKTIYYKISADFDSYDQSTIRTALSNLSAHTGIKFVESASCPARHIEFHLSENSNSSPIGMQDNGNIIYLARYQPVGVAMHETMHSLGYFHEQSRTDRNQYVTIYFENIKDIAKHNFDTYEGKGYEGFNIGDFDFNSVMMYGSADFSSNGQYTMTRNDNYGGGYIYANRSALSEGDIAGLYFLYGPTKAVNNIQIVEDNSSGDREDITYSNTVSFLDGNGKPTVLQYPRLIVADYYYSSQRAGDRETTTVTPCYFIAPAGVSSYSLPNTYYFYEEEGYGIFRQSHQDSYSIYNY